MYPTQAFWGATLFAGCHDMLLNCPALSVFNYLNFLNWIILVSKSMPVILPFRETINHGHSLTPTMWIRKTFNMIHSPFLGEIFTLHISQNGYRRHTKYRIVVLYYSNLAITPRQGLVSSTVLLEPTLRISYDILISLQKQKITTVLTWLCNG